MNPAIGHSGKHLYRFGAFCLDPAERILLRAGKRISLVPKAYDTLLVLVQRSGHVLTKDELIKTVWPNTFVEENNLSQHISSLRRALCEGHNGNTYIETVPRLGYRFVAPVREVWDEDERFTLTRRTQTHVVVREEKEEDIEAEEAAQEEVTTARPVLFLRKQTVWLAAGIALAGLAVTYAYFSWLRPTKALVQALPPLTLTVQPFRNLQPDPESDFLGVALAHVTGAQLSYSSQAALRPSTFVHNYRGSDPSTERAGQAGQVQTLLTGTYLKEGQGVRLSLELVAEPSHATLWHGTFNAGLDGLMPLQDLISEQVGAALHLKIRRIAPDRRNDAESRENRSAYEYFLRGVGAWERHDVRAAIQWHEKAVRLDPGFSPALAYLAFDYISYCYRQSAYPDPDPVEVAYIEKALGLYQKALEADAASPAILSLSGLYLMELGRLDEAVPLLRRAVQLNPNYAQGHLWLSQAYRYGGVLQESRAEAELALRLDPDIREYSTVNTYLYLGEYDRFLQSLPRTQLGARNLFYRGLAHYYKGDLPEAERDFRRAFDMEPALPHAQYAQAFLRALAHEMDEGVRQLRHSERDYQDGEMLYKTAQAYAVLGDKSSALRLLRQSIEHNFYCYPYFQRDPLLDPLRSETEFSALMELARQRNEAFKHKFF